MVLKTRNIFSVLMVCVSLLCGCSSELSSLYDEGVSIELAHYRKENIKDLRYALKFDVPAVLEKDILGEVKIYFSMSELQEVIIDFCEDEEKIKAVEVNGNKVDYSFVNEHIIISDSQFSEGGNIIKIDFVAGNQSVNRNEDFLYTLLVPDRARTLFPCFDQPDLKAVFELQLNVPYDWEAVSNSNVSEERIEEEIKRISFLPTEPLSTYLFSFVAGQLYKRDYNDGKHQLRAYYRETDLKKIAQLDTIFSQVAHSIDWLEEYTGIPYPFAKYDFVILPGFQYGGMEHTGATLYNDTRMFLGENPTPDEELNRTLLIAHETAHMWFGDYVTMKWFDDVWTKEVFANYFAARMTEPLFPAINHRLNWLRSITMPALVEDRTAGTTSIQQPLMNLQDAGLVYGNIIYCKAPIMLEKLVGLMGEDAFREGIREYLQKYSYSNADWDNLIDILDSKTDENLAKFSHVWVKEKGMPKMVFMRDGDVMKIRQTDPYGRDMIWQQRFDVLLYGDSIVRREINITDSITTLKIKPDTKCVLPNVDGRGYGFIVPDNQTMAWLKDNLFEFEDETARQSLLMVLHENYCHNRISPDEWLRILISGLENENNPLIVSSICSYLQEPLLTLKKTEFDSKLFEIAIHHKIPSCKLQLLRVIYANMTSPDVAKQFYGMWIDCSEPLFSESDYMNLSLELSIRFPGKYAEIIEKQRCRITNPDRVRQYDFVSKAISPNEFERDKFFEDLLDAKNRAIEPWAEAALAYLNHPKFQPHSEKYILPALNELEEVQRTGDIFFPRNWVKVLLNSYRSETSYQMVVKFLEDNSNYPPMLKNKILQAAAPLYRSVQTTED